MRKFIKKIWWILLLFAFLPVGLNVGITYFSWGSGSDDAWLGFWGSYLGFGIAGLSLAYQMQLNRNQRIQDNKLIEFQSNPIFEFSFLSGVDKDYNSDVQILYHVQEGKKGIRKKIASEFDKETNQFVSMRVFINMPVKKVIVMAKYKSILSEELKEKTEFFYIGDMYEKKRYIFIFDDFPDSHLLEINTRLEEVYISYVDYLGNRRVQELSIIGKEQKEIGKLTTSFGETSIVDKEAATDVLSKIENPKNVEASSIYTESLGDIVK